MKPLIHEFAVTYRHLVHAALSHGVTEHNARTGRGVVVLPEGASFSLDLSGGVLPTCGLRFVNPLVAAAELAWCLLGHNHCDWLRRHTKVWDQFCDIHDCAECEGEGQIWDALTDYTLKKDCPNCHGTKITYWLEEAYGWRWRGAFGEDQLKIAIDRLKADPSDRRCWISSWDPREDIHPHGQKTVPCPVGFTLQVIGGRLCSTLMIRSSDLYIGLPHDVMRHSLLMAAVAAELGVGLGHARFTLANPHVYEHQLVIAAKMTEREIETPTVAMPNWPVHRIVEEPDYYVETFDRYCQAFTWPPKGPKTEVAR